MSRQYEFSLVKKIVGFAILAVLVILALGLLAINYANGIMLLVGVLIAFTLIWLVRFAARIIPRKSVIFFIIFLAILFPVSFFIFYLQGAAPYTSLQYAVQIPCAISYYRVVLEPETPQLTGLRIREYAVIGEGVNFTPPESWVVADLDNQTGFRLPDREATIRDRGFLLEDVTVEPSLGSYRSAFNGSYNFSPSCGRAIVELRDFPVNSFYAANQAADLQKNPYIDTETITWNAWNLSERNIEFSYIRPPFHILKPLLAPFLSAASLNAWLVGIVGTIGTSIVFPIIGPVLTGTFQKWFIKKLGKEKKTVERTAQSTSLDEGGQEETGIQDNGSHS